MSYRSQTQRIIPLSKRYAMEWQAVKNTKALLINVALTPEAILANLTAFLAGRAGVLGEVHPFGIAFFFMVLQSGRRLRAFSVAGAVLLGMTGSAGAARLIGTAVAMAAVYIVHAKWKSHTKHAPWMQALTLVVILAFCRFGEAYLIGITARGITGLLLEALMVLLSASLFAPLVRLVRVGMPYQLHKEQLSAVGLAAIVVGAGLNGLYFGDIHLADLWSRWVTMTAAFLGHDAIGAAQGTAFGIMMEVAAMQVYGGGSGVYGVSGLLGGLFSRLGRWGVVVGFLLGNLIVSVRASSGVSIVMGFLHTFLAAGLFMLTPNKFIFRLARAIPGTDTEAEMTADRESRLRALVTDQLERLAGVFGEMAAAFAHVDVVDTEIPERDARQQQLRQTCEIVPRQLRGLELIIANTAKHIRLDTWQGDEIAVRVGEELARRKIRYSQLRVLHAGGEHPEVSLVMENACDGEQRCRRLAAQAVTAALVETYTPWQAQCKGRQGGCYLRLLPDRPYDVIIKSATIPKEPGSICGDTYARVELADGKIAVLLSDGMGTGARAALESQATVAMMQQLISAGFDPAFAVQTINSVLLLRSPEEAYATIDLAVIDLFTGELEFLKTGSAPSFIRREYTVEMINSNSLPVGILDEVKLTEKRRLLRPGEMLLMLTDGVLDSLPDRLQKEEWIAHHLRRDRSGDPAGVCTGLLTQVRNMMAEEVHDDMTMVAVKLVKRLSSLNATEDDLPVLQRRSR
ncbi:MAG: SpoIIE family protein phosphatase [Limnochordia bacterium]|jgi:hypothetical protein